jgi:hypothetical protein
MFDITGRRRHEWVIFGGGELTEGTDIFGQLFATRNTPNIRML